MKILITLLLMFSNGFYNAINEGNTITIVEDKINTSNTIWYQNHLDLNQDFNLNFEIYLGSENSRGDGAAFVLSSSTKDPENLIGGIGGLIGALDLSNSLVFEFDTYFNNDNNSPESDKDIHIPGEYRSNGHLGIIETNTVKEKSKHSKYSYSKQETLGDNELRKVSVKWDSANNTISYHVSGFEPMSHKVNIDEVFSGKSKIRFGFSSSNGAKKTSTHVTNINYPHQLEINEFGLDDTPETKTYIYELKNKIEHGKQFFTDLYLESNDKIHNQVLVNDQVHVVKDGSIDLSGFDEDNLTVKISVDKKQEKKNILKLSYQGQSFQSESDWSHEWTEIIPPDPGIPLIPLEPSKPVSPTDPVKPGIPLTPLEPSKPVVPEVPLLPLEPSKPIDPISPIEPEVPLVPELPSYPVTPIVPAVPEQPAKKPSKDKDKVKDEIKKDLVKNPSLPKKDTSDKNDESLLKPDQIKTIFKHSILGKNENDDNTWVSFPFEEVNTGKDLLVFFSSGDHGIFINNKNELSLVNDANLSTPYPVVNEGYEFIGFQNETGEIIEDASFKSNEKYTAIYRKIALAHKDNDKKRSESIMLLFVSFFLLILRWGLNRDIRIREEKKRG